MKNSKISDLTAYIDAYSFVEFSSGKTIINLSRTVEIMRLVYKRLYTKYELSEPKFFVILLLSKEKHGIPLIEIGKMMLVSRANITTLIERMERDGYVEKKGNCDDKRSIKAHLTDKGRCIFDEVKASHQEFSERLVACLTEEEKETLNRLLRKIQFGIIEEFNTQ